MKYSKPYCSLCADYAASTTIVAMDGGVGTPTSRAARFAIIGSLLLILVASLRVTAFFASPFLVRPEAALGNSQRWHLFLDWFAQERHFETGWFNQFLTGFFVMWVIHIAIAGFALVRKSWARKAALVISGLYVVVAVGSLVAGISSKPLSDLIQYLIALLIYGTIYYCFIREDVRELYERPLPVGILSSNLSRGER